MIYIIEPENRNFFFLAVYLFDCWVLILDILRHNLSSLFYLFRSRSKHVTNLNQVSILDSRNGVMIISSSRYALPSTQVMGNESEIDPFSDPGYLNYHLFLHRPY